MNIGFPDTGHDVGLPHDTHLGGTLLEAILAFAFNSFS